MQIGDRIALRRKELGMTQTELAEKMGYKSKAAISKIETNVNNITQSTVVKFAEALDTSIAFLMGWDNPADDKSAESAKPAVTDDDIKFALFGGNVSDAAYEEVKRFAAFVKQNEQEKGN